MKECWKGFPDIRHVLGILAYWFVTGSLTEMSTFLLGFFLLPSTLHFEQAST